MSSGPARYEPSAERRKPKPSCRISRTPSPEISSPLRACALRMEKITSCLRERAMPSRPMDSASSMMASAGRRLSSVRFIGCGSLLCFSVSAGKRTGMGVDIGLEVGLDEGRQLRLGHGADLLGLHGAALEDHQGRDAADA